MFRSLFEPRIRCAECSRTFRPNLEDDLLPDGGVLRRFMCPHCGTQHLVARISLRGRMLMEELQNTPISQQRRIRELRKMIKREVNRPDGRS